jgi:hypothetical protein
MTDQWRNSGAEGIEAMDRFTGAVPARDALERLLAVAMTEEEDVSAATQDEWIAAIQQANEALAESGHIVVLPPASRLQEAEALLERALYLPSMESEDRDLTLTAIRAFFDDAGVSQERPQPDHDINCGIDPLHLGEDIGCTCYVRFDSGQPSTVGVEQLAGILAAAGTMRFDPTHTEAVIEGRLARHGIDYEYIAEWLRGRLRLDAETLARLWREEEITDLDIDCPRVEYEATANAVLQRLFGAER